MAAAGPGAPASQQQHRPAVPWAFTIAAGSSGGVSWPTFQPDATPSPVLHRERVAAVPSAAGAGGCGVILSPAPRDYRLVPPTELRHPIP